MYDETFARTTRGLCTPPRGDKLPTLDMDEVNRQVEEAYDEHLNHENIPYTDKNQTTPGSRWFWW